MLEFAFGSQGSCVDRDVPLKWTTGSVGSSPSPGAPIFVMRTSMTMIRIASMVSRGGRGSPSGGRSETKLYANSSLKSNPAVRCERGGLRLALIT